VVVYFGQRVHPHRHERTGWLFTPSEAHRASFHSAATEPSPRSGSAAGAKSQLPKWTINRLFCPVQDESVNSYISPANLSLHREAARRPKQPAVLFLNGLQEPEAHNVQVLSHEAKSTTQKEGFP